MNANVVQADGTSTAMLDDLVQTFLAPVDLSCLDIEQIKSGISGYQEGSVGLRKRGYSRFPYPREHFAVCAYEGNDGRILAVQEDMRYGIVGERLNASVLASHGMVSLAPGFPGCANGVVPVSLTFPVQGLKKKGWNDVSALPPDLVSVLWGLPYEALEGRAGLLAVQDNVWRPLVRGYLDGYFDLDAISDRCASRGVRRKGA